MTRVLPEAERRLTPAVHDHSATLHADPQRVIARLFLPGEGVVSSHSRAADIVKRVLEIPDERITEMAEQLVADFGTRHPDVEGLFRDNARAVGSRLASDGAMDADRELVLGASFTAEYAVEAAALCNPSAVPHPDQSGLPAGALRVAVALREIGEGHVSSIGFAEAVIDPAGEWTFDERTLPVTTAVVTDGIWSRGHFEAALVHEHYLNELSSAVLGGLPERFSAADVEERVRELPRSLVAHRDSMTDLDIIRRTVSSAYQAEFDEASRLPQRVLLPAAEEEHHGMEDARFVCFTDDDGSVSYRATYTAYDGHNIAPRLLTSPDLRTFATHRLTGPAAQNKGMALFPRRIDGVHFALSRTGGQEISVARSEDGLEWRESTMVHGPSRPWEIIQTGNCGSPLETDRGWLVLTHGVGPMRTYSLGALLLDLDEPSRVLAASSEPFLRPDGALQDGYVPNVVYSCGALLRGQRMYLPYGIGDASVSVVSLDVDDLLDSLTPVEMPLGAPEREPFSGS